MAGVVGLSFRSVSISSPAHVGHDDVGDQQIEGEVQHVGPRLSALPSSQHLVAAGLDHLGQDSSNQRVALGRRIFVMMPLGRGPLHRPELAAATPAIRRRRRLARPRCGRRESA